MSRKLILGSVSRSRLMGLTPIGIVNGREVFPLRGAADDDGETEDKPDGESEEDDEEDDEDEGEKKPAAKGRRDGNDTDSSVIRTLRKQNRELLKKERAREEAEKAKTLADKPEIDRLKVERDDAVKELEELRKTASENSVELAIIRASNSAKSKYAWADIEDVLNDRTLRRAIEIDDDGEISGVEDALKDLAKRKPHFLAKAAEDGDDKSTSGTKGKSTSGTGSKSGVNPGNGGNGKQTVDRARLNSKYPTLARLPQ